MSETPQDRLVASLERDVLPMVQAAVAAQLTELASDLGDKKADARNRATRTFFQNLGIDAAISLLTVLATALVGLDITSKEAWITLGILLAKTALSAPVSYMARLAATPKQVTALPTPAAAQAAAPPTNVYVSPEYPYPTRGA